MVMKNTIDELTELIHLYSNKFNALTDSEFEYKPSPTKWSKKEVVGHLVDSAQNNLRRFIVGQYESTPPKILYEQDFWVAANGYQQAKKEEVIMLWRLSNERICSVLAQMPGANASRLCNTGREQEQLHTIQWLAEDYVKHMKHHINQVIPGSFDIVYK
jgi:hypothetical protein